MFEDRALKKRKDETGDWRKEYNEELHEWYSSLNTRMRWTR
jgi:hypothetical protein